VARVDAFDLSPKSINRRRTRGRRRRHPLLPRRFDDFDAKLGDATDLVCFFGSLHHVREIDTVLEAVCRRMPPGSRLSSTVHGRLLHDLTSARWRRSAAARRSIRVLNPDRPRYVNPTLDAFTGDPSGEARR
jgi:SAM-dependent methyltransferase